MDRYDALTSATSGFASILRQVTPSDWPRPSVDPGWSIRDLVNHVVGGNRRYFVLLSSAPTADVEVLRDLDHLGDDPIAAFEETAAACVAAFHAPGAMEVAVHHRLGDRTGSDLLTMRITEHAVHGWDLARSIGVDDTIDPAVVEVLLGEFEGDPGFVTRSAFTPLDPAANARAQTRLLAFTGRDDA
jgi:uncharacterized protein (TIGR03086 family)